MRPGKHNSELIRRFCSGLKAQGVGVGAIRNYRADVGDFLEWVEETQGSLLELAKLDHEGMDSYREHLSHRFRPTTIRRKMACAKTFSGWMQSTGNDGFLKSKSTRRKSDTKHQQSGWLNLDDVAHYISAVERDGSPQERLIVDLLVVLGLRLSEICALEWEDVLFRDSSIELRVGNKAKHGVRTVQVPEDTAGLVRKLRQQSQFSSGPVFKVDGNPISPPRVRRMCERFGRIAGLEVTSLKLRRTLTASLMHHFPEDAVQSNSDLDSEPEGIERFVRKKGESPTAQEDGSRARRRLVPDDTYLDLVLPDILIGSQSKRAVFTSLRSGMHRDLQVRERVLKRANGTCQRCGFKSHNPNLIEVHHIIAAAEKRDNLNNCIALCPNCHRLAHYAPEQVEIEKQLLLILQGEASGVHAGRVRFQAANEKDSMLRISAKASRRSSR